MGQPDFDDLREIYLQKKHAIEAIWQRRKQPKAEDEMFGLLVSCILSSRAKWHRKFLGQVYKGILGTGASWGRSF